MSNCLLDYVGILTCDGQTDPGSGVFINSLPGISLESIEKIATQDQISYAGVWKDVQNAAFVRFKIDFIAQITKCFEIKKTCDYEAALCENKDILINAWLYLLGNQLMQFRLYTNRLNRYTTVDLDQARELLTFYQVEYEKALEQAAQLVDMSSCTCMEAGGLISHVVWLP